MDSLFDKEDVRQIVADALEIVDALDFHETLRVPVFQTAAQLLAMRTQNVPQTVTVPQHLLQRPR